MSLNLYTYCYNNPVNLFDPTGHVVTAWDKLHCTPDEIEIIEKATADWLIANATGNKSLMASAHSRAEAIRKKYRSNGEYGSADGNTWGKQGRYNTDLYFENQTISAVPQTKVIDFSVKYGVGLDVQLKVNGVGVEVGGKRYYDLTNVASVNATESLQFSLMAQATDKVQIGGSITGTIDATTREHLMNQGFAGIKIGNKVMGWDNLPKDKDFKFEYGVGAYLGAGGEVSVTINVSELWRRIYKSFE